MMMKGVNTITAVVIGVAIVAAAYLMGNAYKYKYRSQQDISVTGLAKKNFESDLVRWSASYQTIDFDMKMASEQLNRNKKIIKDYLLSKGVKEAELRFSAVDIRKDFDYVYDGNGGSRQVFNGYVLSQRLDIESKDLDKIDAISREVSDLISKGIELNSESPNYFYSGLENLKLELIKEATINARKRAENIAKEAHAGLGRLNKARMGVFQITGQNENEDYTYGGVYNTKARNKTASITVKLIFESH